jgi:hypothetical protein
MGSFAVTAIEHQACRRRDARGSSTGSQDMRRAFLTEPGAGQGDRQPGASRGKRVEGWDAIADAVFMRPRWCREAARHGRRHRLPVLYLGRQEGQRQGLPILYLDDLERWLSEAL